MLKYIRIYLPFLVLIICIGCQPQSTKEKSNIPLKVAINNEAFPYDLSKPKAKHKLPKKLAEVSGLGYVDSGYIALVQDERGIIFLFDLDSAIVKEQSYEFERKGDFEGVEIVGDTAYAVRSDGAVFRINHYQSEQKQVQAIKTPLEGRNDVEGLGILPGNKHLLLACKATPNILGKKQKDYRAIYVFDLQTNKLNSTPFLQIPITHIQHLLNDNEYIKLSKDLAETFSAGGNLSFQPSGIAVHPITEDIYVLASVGKLLLVFSKEKTLVNMIKLESTLFKQPEGICFSPQGDLFISNEGKKGKGNILHFVPIK